MIYDVLLQDYNRDERADAASDDSGEKNDTYRQTIGHD
jgi:hypothetical protein